MVPFESTTSSVGVSSASTTVGLLTSIWQSLLHQSSIGVDDNFFSLGGNRRITDLMFVDIARKMGRELPSATIFHAQTIAALALALDQPALLRFSPFVQMKAGTGKSPILIAPVWMAALVSLNSQSGFKLSIRSMEFRPRGWTGWRNPSIALKTWLSTMSWGSMSCNPAGLTS